MHAGDRSSQLEHEVQSLRRQLQDALAAQDQHQHQQQADTAHHHMDSVAAQKSGVQARLDGLEVPGLFSALLCLQHSIEDLR